MKSSHGLRRRRAPLTLRALDAAGRALESVGVSLAPLDDQKLCAAACRKTGLSDFGDERFRPLLRRQIGELQSVLEHLSFPGRLLARAWLLRALRNRLSIEHEIKAHPEILQVTVPRPLVIAGLPRTGTTLLLNLLNQDPGSRPLALGEGFSPASPLNLRQAERLVRFLDHFFPQFRELYILEPNAPVECGMLLRNTFLPRPFFASDLRQWLDTLSAETQEWAYTEYYRQLQLLQWRSPAPHHWLLKSPEHLLALDAVLKVLPEAVIVQTHRDPAQVVPAFCQAIGRFGFFFSDARRGRLPQEVMTFTVQVLHRAMEARQHIPPSRIFDVSYGRLVADPIGVLRELYHRLGYHYSGEFENRVQAFLRQHPAPERDERYYDLEQLGLDRATLDQSFAFYSQTFGLESGTRPTTGAR